MYNNRKKVNHCLKFYMQVTCFYKKSPLSLERKMGTR